MAQVNIDQMVMDRLRAPFGCERVGNRWRIHDANDDAIASVSEREEGYARLIVQALNEHFERKNCVCEGLRHVCGACGFEWPERSAYDELTFENVRFRDENARLRKALQWYADPANNGEREWTDLSGAAYVSVARWRPIDDDAGEVAREALGEAT